MTPSQVQMIEENHRQTAVDNESEDIVNCSKVTMFIQTTFNILKEKKYEDIVSWNKDGSELHIKHTARFADEVLWERFGHRNLSSFTRQMNMYGFKRCASQINQCAFMHPLFKKTSSRKELAMMKRKPCLPKKAGSVAEVTPKVSTRSTHEEYYKNDSKENALLPSESKNGEFFFDVIIPEKESPTWFTSDSNTIETGEFPTDYQRLSLNLFYNQSDSNFSNGQMVQPEEIGLVSPSIGDLLASQFTTTSRFIEELRLVRLQLQRENEKKFEPAYYLEMLLARDLRDF